MTGQRVPVNVCRKCGKALDAAANVTGEGGPDDGDVSICFYCATISVYQDTQLRPPTLTELNGYLDDPRIDRALNLIWTRSAVTATDDGIVLFPCGCHTDSRAGLFTLTACDEICPAAQTILRMADTNGKPMTIIR